MRAYFASLSLREQRIVIVGLAAALVLLPYLLIWQPFVSKLNGMQDRVAAQRQELAWMQQAAREAAALRSGAGTPAAARGGQSLLGIIEQTARRAKLGDAVKKVQPDGQDGARVWLEEVAFDDMLRWIDNLSQQFSVRVVELSVDREEAAGRVNARVLLEAPSA